MESLPQVPQLTLSPTDPNRGTVEWYRYAFQNCMVNPDKLLLVSRACDLIQLNFEAYLEVAIDLKADDPRLFALILGAIHFKEGSCNMKACLQNGELIIGTGLKTTLVPQGRGPFETWQESAIDAITLRPKAWAGLFSQDIGEVLQAIERYNGLGYLIGAGKAHNSPYLWACSNVNDGHGKYVSDGKLDEMASTLGSPGAGVILKACGIQTNASQAV